MLRISVHLKLHNTQRENWKAEGKNCCGRWKAAISHFILKLIHLGPESLGNFLHRNSFNAVIIFPSNWWNKTTEDIILLNTPFIHWKHQRTPNSSRSDFLLEQNRISGQITTVRAVTIHSQSIILTLTVRLAIDRCNGLVKP